MAQLTAARAMLRPVCSSFVNLKTFRFKSSVASPKHSLSILAWQTPFDSGGDITACVINLQENPYTFLWAPKTPFRRTQCNLF